VCVCVCVCVCVFVCHLRGQDSNDKRNTAIRTTVRPSASQAPATPSMYDPLRIPSLPLGQLIPSSCMKAAFPINTLSPPTLQRSPRPGTDMNSVGISLPFEPPAAGALQALPSQASSSSG
jgi:hypothetical protein